MNIQPIEKRELRTDGSLSVHSIFHTIQGEGPFCGVPSVFVRLAGCNLQCPACDTDYTSGRQRMRADWIVDAVRERVGTSMTRLVVITGGEPFRQDISSLVYELLAHDFYVQIETNGTLEPFDLPYNTRPEQRAGVYVICSPKTGKLHPRIYEIACGLKYVLRAGMVGKDGLPTQALNHSVKDVVARPPSGWDRSVFIQPMDETFLNKYDFAKPNRDNYNAAVESALRFGYTLQLQVHKIVGVE